MSYLRFRIFEKFEKVTVAYSTRRGGTSEGPFAANNLGLHVNDEWDHVIANRNDFCDNIGVDFKNLTCAQQEHTNNVVYVTEDKVGWGNDLWGDAIPNCDSLVTNMKGTTLMGLCADCPVVVVYDPMTECIGMAHSGWRGTSKQIIPKMIGELVSLFKSDPKNMIAGIGPCISMEKYQIGDEMIKPLRFLFGSNAENVLFDLDDGTHFDLRAACQTQLLQSGLDPKHIEISPYCTYKEWEMFYSYRRDGEKTGRMGVAIGLI